jgi:hypothetical protein
MKDIILDSDDAVEEPSCSNSSMDDGRGGDTGESAAARKHGCGNGRLINICFGA